MTTTTKLKKAIQDIQDEINALDVDPDDYEEAYREALDSEGPVCVGSITFDPSRILREIDPVAYRCGLIDFADGVQVEDTPKYQELVEELEDIEEKS